MRAYHKPCGSDNIITKEVGRKVQMQFCVHCNRLIETMEIAHLDRRISAVTYKGKAYIFGRECR